MDTSTKKVNPDVALNPLYGKIRTISEDYDAGTKPKSSPETRPKSSSIVEKRNSTELPKPPPPDDTDDPNNNKSKQPEHNEHAGQIDVESSPARKVPYPKSVFFIISNEFCERFTYYGLRTILALYLKNQLHFDSDTATVIYHVFIMFCYFFPLLGAILADSWLGKFRTIFYLSVVYAIGNIILAVASADWIPDKAFTMVGLVLISLGTGGIKPCVAAFGGDQFVLPEQEKPLQKFFSVFYFAINAGSVISTFLTPVLREDVSCSGLGIESDSCYPLAYGVPAILMVVSLIVFLVGKRWYKTKTPGKNVIVEVVKCMWYAARKKSPTKRDHWLDKADDRFDKTFISDVKAALRVLVLYIPLPIFWALFDQQGSRWTFQAARMSGELNGFKIKPDQMQVVNPVLILVFIPLFETVVYPLFAKCNLLKRPLQKFVVGGVLAAIAFVISAVVETQLEPTYPVLPKADFGQIRIYNDLNCNVTINADILSTESKVLQSLDMWAELEIKVENQTSFNINIKGDCLKQDINKEITIFEEEATSYTILANSDLLQVRQENTDKSDNGDPTIMIVLSIPGTDDYNKTIEFWESDGSKVHTSFTLNRTYPYMNFTKIETDEFLVKVDGNEVKPQRSSRVYFDQGGAYTLLFNENNEGNYTFEYVTVTNPNTVHMLWLVPQYVVITAGEVMFSITGLEFSFTQAPVTMKSLLQAIWLITVAIGNLVVVIVAESKIFSSQTYEFILFAGLMFVDMIIFAYMCMKYTYVEDMKKDDNENIEITDINKKKENHIE